MTGHPQDTKKEVRTYVNVFLALMVLTVVTVAISYVQLAVPLAITAALIIATVKGSLVASFFMHLLHENRLIFAALLLTVAFFLVLIFIPLATQADHFGRPVEIDGIKAPAEPAREH
jgi:caa(3)-type oxidase subunit IV